MIIILGAIIYLGKVSQIISGTGKIMQSKPELLKNAPGRSRRTTPRRRPPEPRGRHEPSIREIAVSKTGAPRAEKLSKEARAGYRVLGDGSRAMDLRHNDNNN